MLRSITLPQSLKVHTSMLVMFCMSEINITLTSQANAARNHWMKRASKVIHKQDAGNEILNTQNRTVLHVISRYAMDIKGSHYDHSISHCCKQFYSMYLILNSQCLSSQLQWYLVILLVFITSILNYINSLFMCRIGNS